MSKSPFFEGQTWQVTYVGDGGIAVESPTGERLHIPTDRIRKLPTKAQIATAVPGVEYRTGELACQK